MEHVDSWVLESLLVTAFGRTVEGSAKLFKRYVGLRLLLLHRVIATSIANQHSLKAAPIYVQI
jgi:hypothetical protein